MPRPTEETRCENCQWHQPETKLWKSSCKAYPPTLGSGHCGHPTTDSHDWCREFTPTKNNHLTPIDLVPLKSLISTMRSGAERELFFAFLEKLKEIISHNASI